MQGCFSGLMDGVVAAIFTLSCHDGELIKCFTLFALNPTCSVFFWGLGTTKNLL